MPTSTSPSAALAFAALALGLLTRDARAQSVAPPFANPVVPFDCPDPGILALPDPEPIYYMVCTGGSFPIRRSHDLVHWEDTGASILPSGAPAWAANGGRNWAPELHKVGDRFIAYYTSVNGSDVLSIGAAWATSPLGPYTDLGHPLVEHGEGVIDANYFRDSDGKHYLFVKIDGNAHGNPTRILASPLAPDGLSFPAGSSFVEVLRSGLGWEGGVVEGSWTVRRGGYYYLFYSGNSYDTKYRTSVARSTSVLGPYEKLGAPLLGNNGQWGGPGHGSVVPVGAEDWLFYHAWDVPSGAGRFGMLDRITWGAGWPSIGGGSPTAGPQGLPGGQYAITLLNEQPSAYAPPTSTDVDGDGRADVCARGVDGLFCWPATATGYGAAWAPVPLSDANGWSLTQYRATLRMGDVDGDGRADACARSSAGVMCATSTGAGFGDATIWWSGMTDANGWDHPRYYSTLRLADVDGDHRDDLCARDSQGFGCWLSDGKAFKQRVEGPAWLDAAGHDTAQVYGTVRMGDLDGDGRADVCVRSHEGVRCARSEGVKFSKEWAGPAWTDALGFDAIQYWSTLRMVDVNGDLRADLCVRTASDLRCHLGTGAGFGEAVIVAAASDANGWHDYSNYTTLRTGDVTGDGAIDLCARANELVLCWAWTGSGFAEIKGPPLSDASGWGASPAYYETLRLADRDGDGRADLCARGVDGWRCYGSTGQGFGDPVLLGGLADSGGWAAPRYVDTILSGGARCVAKAEVCNGRDDDCDGVVDDGACAGGAGGGAAGGGSGGASGSMVGSGGASGSVVGKGGVAGSQAITTLGARTAADGSDEEGGCACRADRARDRRGASALALIAFAWWAARRRR